jgi:hypothetical protein
MAIDNIFSSEYPILSVAMNQVSNFNLAVAVRSAGCTPSLTVFNYLKNSLFQKDLLLEDLKKYKNIFSDCNIVVSADLDYIIDDSFISLLIENDVTFLEIILNEKYQYNHFIKNIENNLKKLKLNGTKVLLKVVDFPFDFDSFVSKIDVKLDAIIIKTQEGAGRVSIDSQFTDPKTMIDYIREKYPDMIIIISGGIGNADDIINFQKLNINTFGIGTLFAASKESPLSEETKNKIINSNSSDIKKIKTNHPHLPQNGLIFGELESKDNGNNTFSLRAGINDPRKGILFSGKAVDKISNIKSCDEIVSELSIAFRRHDHNNKN